MLLNHRRLLEAYPDQIGRCGRAACSKVALCWPRDVGLPGRGPGAGSEGAEVVGKSGPRRQATAGHPSYVGGPSFEASSGCVSELRAVSSRCPLPSVHMIIRTLRMDPLFDLLGWFTVRAMLGKFMD